MERADWVAFSPDGQKLFARGLGDIRAWLLKSKRVRLDWQFGTTTKDNIRNCALTPDGRYLVGVGLGWPSEFGTQGVILIWELRTGRLAKKWFTHGREALTVACHPGGKLFATGSDDGDILLWDFPSCKKVRHLRVSSSVHRLCFIPPGKRLLIGTQRGLFLAEVEGGKMTALEEAEDASLLALATDGKKIAGTMARTIYGPALEGKGPRQEKNISWVRLWDAASGKKLKDIDLVEVGCLVFHPNGRHLLVFPATADVILWNVRTWRRAATWHLPDMAIRAALSPAGDRLVTSHTKSALRLWKLQLPKGP